MVSFLEVEMAARPSHALSDDDENTTLLSDWLR